MLEIEKNQWLRRHPLIDTWRRECRAISRAGRQEADPPAPSRKRGSMARKNNPLDPRQLDLFEAPATPPNEAGALNIKEAVLEAVTEMVKASPLSRIQIAEKMTELTATRITEVMLNAWTAESRNGHRFPLEYAPALEMTTESTALTDLMVKLAGGEIYYGVDALKARLGTLEMDKQTITESIKTLKQKARTA